MMGMGLAGALKAGTLSPLQGMALQNMGNNSGLPPGALSMLMGAGSKNFDKAGAAKGLTLPPGYGGGGLVPGLGVQTALSNSPVLGGLMKRFGLGGA